MAFVNSIGEGCHVVVKNTFWDLEDEEEMEEITVQQPRALRRALSDSELLRSIYVDDATDDASDDDDGKCLLNENLSSTGTDTGSSTDEIRSQPSSRSWSESDEEETSTGCFAAHFEAMAVVNSTGEGCHAVVNNTFWDLEDEEEMEDMVPLRRAFSDSDLLRCIYVDDLTVDDVCEFMPQLMPKDDLNEGCDGDSDGGEHADDQPRLQAASGLHENGLAEEVACTNGEQIGMRAELARARIANANAWSAQIASRRGQCQFFH